VKAHTKNPHHNWGSCGIYKPKSTWER